MSKKVLLAIFVIDLILAMCVSAAIVNGVGPIDVPLY